MDIYTHANLAKPYTHANLAKPDVVVLYTELNNMERNYLVHPSQADDKHCVYVVLFLTFI